MHAAHLDVVQQCRANNVHRTAAWGSAWLANLCKHMHMASSSWRYLTVTFILTAEAWAEACGAEACAIGGGDVSTEVAAGACTGTGFTLAPP